MVRRGSWVQSPVPARKRRKYRGLSVRIPYRRSQGLLVAQWQSTREVSRFNILAVNRIWVRAEASLAAKKILVSCDRGVSG